MSQVRRTLALLLLGCAALVLVVGGCSKKRGTPFDPDAGHPEDFFPTHPAEYRASQGSCSTCHGADLLGGIANVSCFSMTRDGRACHPGGPGGHPAGWRSLHTALDPAQATTCAACHDNPANNLPPGCFNNSLCHGPRSGHPADWITAHARSNPALATSCARCHDNPGNDLPPGCFNNSLCHGQKAPHPAGWLAQHSGTPTSQAPTCAQCHDNPFNSLPPGCFNNSLCHGEKSPHPAGWGQSSQHGPAAKGSPGMGSCQACHGSSYAGGTSGQSCFPCHGWRAPHGRSGWDGGGGSHRSTAQGNAGACAQCHREAAGTAGCFNGTLCHGD